MGYETDLLPLRGWFSGRLFLKKATELRKQLRGLKTPSPDDIATCEEAKLYILRGIRVALGAPADDEKVNIPLYQLLRGRMNNDRLASLMDIIDRKLRYNYQAGEPCQHCDKGSHLIVDAKISGAIQAPAKAGNSLQIELLRERLAQVDDLNAMAQEIFFHDVYAAREGFTYGYKTYREDLEQSAIVGRIIELGLAQDEDEALNKYGEGGWIDPFDWKQELNDAFFQDYTAARRDDYEENFWEWDESELELPDACPI